MADKRSVSITAHATTGTLKVDGNDLTDAVRGVDISLRAGHLPVIHLDLVILDLESVTTDAKVFIPDATREALIALGWTPPEE